MFVELRRFALNESVDFRGFNFMCLIGDGPNSSCSLIAFVTSGKIDKCLFLYSDEQLQL